LVQVLHLAVLILVTVEEMAVAVRILLTALDEELEAVLVDILAQVAQGGQTHIYLDLIVCPPLIHQVQIYLAQPGLGVAEAAAYQRWAVAVKGAEAEAV